MRSVTPDPADPFESAFNVGNLNGSPTLTASVGPADSAGSTLATARNIGSATDITIHEFVGRDAGSGLNDPSDYYKIKMDAPGNLEVTMSTDDATLLAQNHVEIIHDFNNNGVIELGDMVRVTGFGEFVATSATLAPGTYYVGVVSATAGSNYHVRITADYAGKTPATQRVMGSLDTGKSFNDFISTTDDAVDQYTFSVGSSRPLHLIMSEPGGQSTLEVFKDSNHNGHADVGEGVASTSGAAFNQLLTTIGPGNYIVQVKASVAGGTYNLFAEAPPDRAGNTLGTAKNLGTLNGLTHRDDFVSDQDPVDLYKFTAAAAGTVGASLGTTIGNADLALIRDANNNGKVDAGEILKMGTITSLEGAKELTSVIAPGNYFLRVTYLRPVMTAQYFLSFQTDYAGTAKTPRNVGTLFGTKTFDDWASGPFSGAINDTEDVYKFTLTSARTLTAKLAGVLSGQDLNLELYRDKNNDGVLVASERISSSAKPDTANEQISKSLGAGTYFVRVVGINGETNYHLKLTA